MGKIFVLNPDDEKRFHPYALQRFNEWKRDIISCVPQLGELDVGRIEVDVSTILTDDEKARLVKYRVEIVEWLKRCLDLRDDYSPSPYDTHVVDPMLGIKSLLREVYERKEAKKKEEQGKREYEKRWQAAFETLAPPLDYAKIYLSNEEHQRFEGSIFGAVNARLEKGEKYSSDARASEYCKLCAVIRERREECQRKKAAKSESWRYNRTLIDEIGKLKSVLHNQPQKVEDCFERNVVDTRFTRQRLVELLSIEEKVGLRARFDRIARGKLQELVPGTLSEFISWEPKLFLFVLPSADYSFDGVPCLDFILDTFAVVETRVWLRPLKKRFGDYVFALPWVEYRVEPYGGYFKKLETPELLGYHYLVLTPDDTGIYPFWQRVPLALMKGLILGDAEPTGTMVVRVSESETEYSVKKFKGGEVNIPDSFATYMKEIGGIDEMEIAGILSEKIANQVRGKFTELEASSEPEIARNVQDGVFTTERLISSLTILGVPKKYAEMVTGLIPTSLSLKEATKLAMQKYTEILHGQNSEV